MVDLAELAELRVEPSWGQMFCFYGRLTLFLRGPAAFLAGVAEYFWPQLRPAVAGEKMITIEVLVGNPHTGSQIVVAGRHVRVLNPNLTLGVRDAIRVIKQLVTTTFEADGALVLHAAAFTADGGAVSGVRLISNDRLYAWPTSAQTTVVGWTDPIRVISTSPDQPKRTIPLIQHAHRDRSQVAEQPLPLAAIVVPDVRPAPFPLVCEDLGHTTGDAALRAAILLQRVRWLGLEPNPRSPAAGTQRRSRAAVQDDDVDMARRRHVQGFCLRTRTRRGNGLSQIILDKDQPRWH